MEQPLNTGRTKGLAFDFGESSQNVDQSVNYNIQGGQAIDFFRSIPTPAIYAMVGVAALVLIAMLRK